MMTQSPSVRQPELRTESAGSAVRAGKNILVPTEAGKILYRSWKDVISAMQESVEVARRHMGGDIKKLNIGVFDIHKSEAYLWSTWKNSENNIRV